MNSPNPEPAAPRRNWTHVLVNLLVALLVIAVAAATFVFSYDGVHAIALVGGVSTQLARYYPGLFDAVLVIACVAAVMLRDGRWWARLWAWLVVIIILGAIGVTDVLHAMDYTLRHRVTEGIVAAAPVVAVLLAFSLLLTLLRQSRTQAAPAPPTAPVTRDDLPVLPALPAAAGLAPMALPAALGFPEEAPQDMIPWPEEWATEPDVVLVPPAQGSTEQAPAAQEAPAPPTVEVPAPPTVEVPASPTVQVPELASEPPTRPLGIRYAGRGVPGMAGNAWPSEPTEPDEPTEPTELPTAEAEPLPQEYWETEEAGQFAGLVYPARETAEGETGDADDEVNDAEEAEPAARPTPPELDDDAPPFATAPFAAVPRLNRVRSMPTPPADEDE
jgi:hypothetical protein